MISAEKLVDTLELNEELHCSELASEALNSLKPRKFCSLDGIKATQIPLIKHPVAANNSPCIITTIGG